MLTQTMLPCLPNEIAHAHADPDHVAMLVFDVRRTLVLTVLTCDMTRYGRPRVAIYRTIMYKEW